MAGPVLTVTNMISDVRLHVRDTNTTSPGLSDSNVVSLLNRAYYDYCSIMDGDEVLTTSTNVTLNQGSSTGSASFSVTPLSIESCYLSGVKKLKKSNLQDLLSLRAENPSDTGEPTYFAVDFAGSRDTATVYFDTSADQTYTAVLWFRKEPAALAAGNGTVPMGDHAAYTICMMAAVNAARVLGRPADFVNALGSQLPESIRSHMAVTFRATSKAGADPRREP